MANVRAVAKYFIGLSEEGTPFAITPLKLQKLLYYAHGYHLVNTEEPLFDNDLEAWAHGPVVPEIYFAYKKFGYLTIPNAPFDDSEGLLTGDEQEAIDQTQETYGHLDGKFLEELTHRENPWLETPRNGVINNNLIREYFEEELVIA